MQNTEKPRVAVLDISGPTHSQSYLRKIFPNDEPKKKTNRRTIRAKETRPSLAANLRLRQKRPFKAFSIRINGRLYKFRGESRSEVYFEAALGLRRAGWSDRDIARAIVATPTWRSREASGKYEDIDRLLCKLDEHIDQSKEAEKREQTQSEPFEDPFGSFDSLEPEEACFLVYPYVVLGAITMLDGDPKQGKSSFTAALAAHVTTARDLPFGKLERSGRVLFFSIEDDPAKIILPRLRANGADTTKCRYLKEYMALDNNGLDALDAELERHPATLVIIDPLFTYMDAAANSNSATDMARYMTGLSEIAARRDCAILAVRHLNKSDSQDILTRGMGSKAIVGTARSGLLLAKHPTDSDLRAIAHTAANWGPQGDSILFAMEESNDRSPPRLAWRGVDKSMDGASLLVEPSSSSATGRKPKEGIEAAMLLKTLLVDGPVDGRKVKDTAERLGVSEQTLRRAREEIGVQITKQGRSRIYRLPGNE